MPTTCLVSWNQVRELMEQEFKELLTYLPQGTEEVQLLEKVQFSNLVSLASFICSFRRHYPKERVIDILHNEGGLTALLAGDDTHLNCLTQEYLD